MRNKIQVLLVAIGVSIAGLVGSTVTAAPASATTYSGWSTPALCFFGSGQWTPVQFRLEYTETYPTQRHIYQVRIGTSIPGYGNDELISTILFQEYSSPTRAIGHRYQYPATLGTGWAVFGWTSPPMGVYYMPYVTNTDWMRVKVQLIRSPERGGGACEVWMP